jgi:hypothetical protein
MWLQQHDAALEMYMHSCLQCSALVVMDESVSPGSGCGNTGGERRMPTLNVFVIQQTYG